MKLFNKLIVMALLCSLFVGCGSDEEGGAPAQPVQAPAAPTTPAPVTSAGLGSSSFDDFKNKVVAGQFASLATQNKDYYYQECSVETRDGKWYTFGQDFNVTSCNGTFLRRVSSGNVDREDDNRNSEADAKAFLSSIMSSVSANMAQVDASATDGSAYYVISGDKLYKIDLTFPAIANPVESYGLELVPYQGYRPTGESYKMNWYFPGYPEYPGAPGTKN